MLVTGEIRHGESHQEKVLELNECCSMVSGVKYFVNGALSGLFLGCYYHFSKVL